MIRALGLIAAAMILSGCAGWGVSGSDDGERWSLSGKLGIRQDGQAESVLLNWTTCGERYRLTLSGPFGQQLARVEGGRQGAVFRIDDQPPEYTTDPQAWLDRRLGLPLPVDELRYWVRGRTAPGDPAALSHNAAGELVGIRQSQWRIEYLQFHDAVQPPLPRRLRASRSDLVATLVIRQWQLGAEVETCPAP